MQRLFFQSNIGTLWFMLGVPQSPRPLPEGAGVIASGLSSRFLDQLGSHEQLNMNILSSGYSFL